MQGIIRAHELGVVMQDFIQFTNDNMLLVAAFAASGLAVIFYELKLKTQSVGSVSSSVAIQLINSGYTVVDIRDTEKYANGHILDAKHIPEAELAAEPAKLTPNKKGTLLVCDHGARSGACAAKLRKDGLDNVFSIKGGTHAWIQDNLPVVSS
jgi:rhodanese-related sulfurtransferase